MNLHFRPIYCVFSRILVKFQSHWPVSKESWSNFGRWYQKLVTFQGKRVETPPKWVPCGGDFNQRVVQIASKLVKSTGQRSVKQSKPVKMAPNLVCSWSNDTQNWSNSNWNQSKSVASDELMIKWVPKLVTFGHQPLKMGHTQHNQVKKFLKNKKQKKRVPNTWNS